MRANCATKDVPDWSQPNSSMVTFGLYQKLADKWPRVDLTLDLDLDLFGVEDLECQVSILDWDVKSETVKMTPSREGHQIGTVKVPFGAQIKVDVLAQGSTLSTFTGVVDTAFDWQKNERIHDMALRSMALTINHKMKQ